MAFEWFKDLFQIGRFSGKEGGVDPESGRVLKPYSGLGRSEGPNEGSGEGSSNWGAMTKQQYGNIGRAFQAQQVGPSSSNIQSGINAGFNQNWLAEQEHAGSAEGQKL